MTQQGPPAPPERHSLNRWLTTLILVAILVMIAIIGYVVVDTITALRQPANLIPGAVGTQVQQVLNPTPTLIADPQTIIKQVQSLARLETASYTIQKVITSSAYNFYDKAHGGGLWYGKHYSKGEPRVGDPAVRV